MRWVKSRKKKNESGPGAQEKEANVGGCLTAKEITSAEEAKNKHPKDNPSFHITGREK